MTQNNNLSVLPFYSSLSEQTRNRPYAYGEVYPLYVPVGKLPTFQLCGPSGAVGSITLYKADGTIAGYLSSGLISSKTVGNYTVYYHTGGSSGLYSGEGQYYIVVTIGGTSYYSDVFTAVADISAYLKIEWWDEEDFLMDGAGIAYALGGSTYFKNVVYLNSQLGKPEYEFEEEGEKRDGLFFPEKMISEKTYKFNFLANEPLCDVMRLARMADHVQVTDRYGTVYTCDTFLITPKWETQGNVASVDGEFQTNMVAKRIGRNFT
jgi:hypothetical protein